MFVSGAYGGFQVQELQNLFLMLNLSQLKKIQTESEVITEVELPVEAASGSCDDVESAVDGTSELADEVESTVDGASELADDVESTHGASEVSMLNLRLKLKLTDVESTVDGASGAC